MVEKKYQDRLQIKVPSDELTFTEHADNLQSHYDQKLLQENLPPTSGVIHSDKVLAESLDRVLPESTKDALNQTEFIGVFGRIITQQAHLGILCLQYLYVWDYQAVPTHEADYEPIFVFLNGNERYALYDLVHYCSRRLDLSPVGKDGPGLRMVPGWHSFLPISSLQRSSLDSDLKVQPLSDKHLHSWWTIPDEAPRLKINEYMLNPYILESPGHFLISPDEESRTICCVFSEIETAIREFDDPRTGLIEGIKRALTRCIGLFALHRLGALVTLLSEMNEVGLVNLGGQFKSGFNLGAITQMLRDGFLTLTQSGQSFFEGLRKKKDDTD
jgi:hypothetical protein